VSGATQDLAQLLGLTDSTLPGWTRHRENLELVLQGRYDRLRPITAEFVVTLLCPFRCAQCAYKEPKQTVGAWGRSNIDSPRSRNNQKDRLHMPSGLAKLCVDRLAEGGVKNVLFTGGGEPLMNREVVLMAMQRARALGCNVALYTNGVLLSPETSTRVLGQKPTFVRVSVYGGTGAAFKQYTGASKQLYQKVFRNIDELARQKILRKSDVTIGISFLLHPKTWESVAEFAKRVVSLPNRGGIDYVRFTPAVDYFHGVQHDQDRLESVFERIERDVAPVLADAGIQPKLYRHRLDDLNGSKSYKTCRASGWFVEVGPSGELYLCCEKHFQPAYRIGDLRKQSIAAVWRSRKRRETLARVNAAGCGGCPTLCKPHELNKVFAAVEKERAAGRIDEVRRVATLFASRASTYAYCPGKFDDYQS